MGEKASFFVLRAKAVPEVLLRVVEAKRLLDSGKVESVQEATEMVQISRSSFYKYKDDIFPYHENAKGKTVNMVIQLDDEPGLLSMVLKTIAEFHANILTIHQSVPVKWSLCRKPQRWYRSAEALSTNIRTIYFHIMKMQKEKRSIW